MRCFIIGNGPSLNKHDLTKLKNEITFGCNRIYLKEREMGFAVNYYFCVDSIMPLIIKKDILKYIKADELREAYILQNFKKFFEHPKIIFVNSYHSVGINMIKSAQRKEYNPIYLIGFDLDYKYPPSSEIAILTSVDQFPVTDSIKNDLKQVSSSINMNDVFICKGESDNSHFSDEYLKNIPGHYDTSNNIISQYKNLIGNSKDIINAGIGGKCDFFPRIDYDSLFINNQENIDNNNNSK